MKALLLAAGLGTRLGSLTHDRPKPLVELGGRPMIDYSLAWLRRQGVDSAAINLHHMADRLRQYVGDGSAFGLEVHYSVEPELLGSAGALVPLRKFFQDAGSFVVLYGDVLTDLDLTPVLEQHQRLESDVTLVVTTADDPTRCGVVAFDADRAVTRIQEKPRREEVFSHWVNAGVYVCSSRVLEALPHPCPVPFDFARDLFPRSLAAGRTLAAYPTDEFVIDIGSRERLGEAARALRDGRLRHVPAVTSC